jgi:glycosyltransferase involved in cell wall biosynthesis
VYVYGFPELAVALSKRNDIYVFEERTEHNNASFICNIKKTPIPVFLDACRRISGMIVISQGLKQYYISNGCHPEKVHVINMIVDSTRFKDLQKKPSEPYIAYCGTASNTKDGVDQLIKAFALVLKHHPEYKLYIIGSTPSKKQRFDNYELTKELEIENNVVFTGVVPAEQMPQILKNATILALDRPNNLQAKYGFPTKLGEYLLTGNPVVVTDVGDISLFLKDGESALIATPDDMEDFAKKLCWTIEHPEESKNIGEQGRVVAEKHFNYLAETKKISQIIKS